MRPCRSGAPARAKTGPVWTADRFEIISNLSHELRSPLHVINGYLDILAEDWAAELGTEGARILERLHLSTADLKQTVENLLEYAAAMTATQAVVRETVDVDDLTAELKQTFEAAAQRKKISLAWLVEPGLKVVHSDRRRLLSIVANLVSNAIKFTARGSVTVRLRRVRAHHRCEVELEVVDTGIGMEEGRIEDAFTPFVQLSSSSARAHRGLGLGLALVRRNAISLGATLEVRSRPSAGSSFRVRFPAELQPQASDDGGRTARNSNAAGVMARDRIHSHRHRPIRHDTEARLGIRHDDRRQAADVYA